MMPIRLAAVSLLALAFATIPSAATASPPKTDTPSEAPTAPADAAADAPLVPPSPGAILVPALTDADLEPAVLVRSGDAVVAQGGTGEPIPVPPGDYELSLMAQASPEYQPAARVHVSPGQTVEVEPSWAALVVDVVDDKNISFRGGYDLIAMEGKRYVGTGKGANRLDGEPINTWLLPPGLYKIVKVGGAYFDRIDFITVRLVAGQASRIKLVQDRDSGAFRGGGLVFEEDKTVVATDVEANGTLGGDFNFMHNRKRLGKVDGYTYEMVGFLDLDVLMDKPQHYLYSYAQVNVGGAIEPETPFAKDTDTARLDGFYLWKLTPSVGPYLRFGLRTNVLPFHDEFDVDTDVTVEGPDGEPERTESGLTRFQIASYFGLVELRQGLGMNWRPAKTAYLDAFLRLGVGFQQSLVSDLLSRQDDGAVEGVARYKRLETYHNEGLEASLMLMGSLTGWLTYNAEARVLDPFDDLRSPIFDARLSASLHVIRFVALAYSFLALSDPDLSPFFQLGHELSVRISIPIL